MENNPDDLALIEYQEKTNEEAQSWALAPSAHADENARGLLESLWDEGFKSPAVFIDGNKLRVRRPNGWKREQDHEVLHLGKNLVGCWEIKHVPTRRIVMSMQSKYDADFLMDSIKSMAGEGFNSSNPQEVIDSFPPGFGQFLVERGFAESYEHFIKKSSS